MKKSEVQEKMENLLEKYRKDMETFREDKNPQIRELYLQVKGAYDGLDELYWRLFHRYY